MSKRDKLEEMRDQLAQMYVDLKYMGLSRYCTIANAEDGISAAQVNIAEALRYNGEDVEIWKQDLGEVN